MKTIEVPNANSTATLQAKLYSSHGPLAVTRIESDNHYNVTHLATGGKCRGFRLLKSARAAAEAWKGFDWNIAAHDDKPKLSIIYAQMKLTPEFNVD